MVFKRPAHRYWYPLLLVFSIILLLTGKKLYHLIFPPGEKYGIAYNTERQRLGIALLPDNWVTNDKAGETKIWYPPNRPDSGSFRSSKVVVVKSGEIVYDGDIYLRISGDRYDKLTTGYKFRDNHSWEFKYYNPSVGTKEIVITKYRADSILNSWGLKYK
ncbi:hypothetical protein [Chitinophaga arvensicola]|uniref:Uncharacterized protein n=1 Tax=Chitinophaga arvensicola TaxID=29529 RepID=A0A1I0S8L5_9BACT|nr:hypothetical protein [Chitinophaga arvensicola]SEW52430.1 hypothetical protein SAMN04488122_4823 [Chitinophaga arvensicola]